MKAGVLLIGALGVLFSGATLAQEFEVDGVQLPGIPSKKAQEPSRRTPQPSELGAGTEPDAPAAVKKRSYTFAASGNDQPPPSGISAPLEIEVKPGENQVLTVSKGYANRIVTPFDQPVIRSTEPEGTFYVEGNMVYLAPTDEKTISAWILDSGGGPALNLAFLPRPVPPREIRVKIKDEKSSFNYSANRNAIPTESSAPFQVAVTELLTAIAKTYIPTGYTLADPSADEYMEFFCSLPASNVSLEQVLTGHKWKVGVSRVRNNSHFALEIRESDCQQDGVLAIAAYPHAVVAPGAEVELFIVRLREKPATGNQRRRPPVATN